MYDPDSMNPCDDIRQAWNRLPEPDEPRSDPQTEAVVHWMRQAWATVGADSAAPPVDPPVQLRRPHGPRRRWWAAAAAAAGILGWVLSGLDLRETPVAPVSPLTAPVVTNTSPVPETTPPPIQLFPRADGLELRSGPVRLVLIRPDSVSDAD